MKLSRNQLRGLITETFRQLNETPDTVENDPDVINAVETLAQTLAEYLANSPAVDDSADAFVPELMNDVWEAVRNIIEKY